MTTEMMDASRWGALQLTARNDSRPLIAFCLYRPPRLPRPPLLSEHTSHLGMAARCSSMALLQNAPENRYRIGIGSGPNRLPNATFCADPHPV
eukprot:133070-Rhodomonas_salina.5